jgi:hypothetical protein
MNPKDRNKKTQKDQPKQKKQTQKVIKTEAGKSFVNLFDDDRFIYLLLGIAVLFVFIARMHLLSFPFERDEGEYAYMGKLILDGHAPYTLAYNMKLPGTYFMYAIIMGVFGESVVGVHLGLAFIIIASMVLVFFISRNFLSKIGSIISSVSFGIIGTSWTLLAQAAHATHFVNFFALLGVYTILQRYKTENKRLLKYFISGVFFSLAFMCKQPGLFFLFFGFTVIIIKEFNLKTRLNLVKNLAILSLGFVIPVIVMLLYFYFFGDFGKFWFWTVEYLIKYGEQVPIAEVPNMFIRGIASMTGSFSSVGYTALWVISLIGIPLIFIHKASIQTKILLFAFLLFSFLTVTPGFYFRNHYFITLLPAAALFMALFFEVFNDYVIHKFKRPHLLLLGFLVFLVLMGSGIKSNINYLFKQNPQISCKQVYGSNPFVESVAIAAFIKQNTDKNDKIAVLGSEPQICFYADRYSATGYIYTYNMLELHPYALSMQKEMAKEIESYNPQYIIYVNIGTSWLARPKSEKFIFKWADEYTNKNYRIVGVLDILPNGFSTIKVGEQLDHYKPQTQDLIYILKRNT